MQNYFAKAAWVISPIKMAKQCQHLGLDLQVVATRRPKKRDTRRIILALTNKFIVITANAIWFRN